MPCGGSVFCPTSSLPKTCCLQMPYDVTRSRRTRQVRPENLPKLGFPSALSTRSSLRSAGKAGLDLSATGAHSVEYAYTQVTADVVNLARLEMLGCPVRTWRPEPDVSPTCWWPSASTWSWPRSKPAGVTSKMRDEKGVDLKVDIPTVEQLVGGGVTVSGSSART